MAASDQYGLKAGTLTITRRSSCVAAVVRSIHGVRLISDAAFIVYGYMVCRPPHSAATPLERWHGQEEWGGAVYSTQHFDPGQGVGASRCW